jgi:hypothetical protein
MLGPRGVSSKAGNAAMRLGRLVGLSLALAVLFLPLRSASAARGKDQLQVVDEFLTARSLNDVWGATEAVSDLLKVRDGVGERTLDQPQSRLWLQHLTDAYVFNIQVHPSIDGDSVSWVEWLTPRSGWTAEERARSGIPLGTSVAVEALVDDGKIVAYTAAYPPPQTALPAQTAPTLQSLAASRPEVVVDTIRPLAESMLWYAAGVVSGAVLLFAVSRARNPGLKRPYDANPVAGPKTMRLGGWVARGRRVSTRRDA